MSSTISAWAFQQDTPTPIDKLVLIVIADGVDPDGWWGGALEAVAAVCGLSVDQVRTSLDSLVAANVIGCVQGRYHLGE